MLCEVVDVVSLRTTPRKRETKESGDYEYFRKPSMDGFFLLVNDCVMCIVKGRRVYSPACTSVFGAMDWHSVFVVIVVVVIMSISIIVFPFVSFFLFAVSAVLRPIKLFSVRQINFCT